MENDRLGASVERLHWRAAVQRMFGGIPIESRFDFIRAGSSDPSIPSIVIELMSRTKRLYRFWWAAHYTVGLTGVVAGALLTALTSAQTTAGSQEISWFFALLDKYSWLIGIIAAVSTSLVTFLGPLHKAERYWSAYHHLEQACLEYRGVDSDPRMKRLMTRVMQARKILQVVDPDERIGTLGNDVSPAT